MLSFTFLLRGVRPADMHAFAFALMLSFAFLLRGFRPVFPHAFAIALTIRFEEPTARFRVADVLFDFVVQGSHVPHLNVQFFWQPVTRCAR